MPIARSISHGSAGGWTAVALHLAPAEEGKDGFYLSLFPDGKAATSVFLRPPQVQQLLDMAQAADQFTDQQLWDVVAKIPLEPLLPNRALGARLRTLLCDCAAQVREQIRVQADRRPPPSPAVDATAPDPNIPPKEPHLL